MSEGGKRAGEGGRGREGSFVLFLLNVLRC